MEQPFQDDSSQEEQTVSTEWNKWSPAVNVAAKNWKAWLAFWKTTPMPAKNWKKDFDKFAVKPIEKKEKPSKNIQKQSETDQNEEFSSKTMKHQPLRKTPLKRSQKPLKRTPLAPIWKKKKERLKNEWSEVDVFLDVWNTREHICEVCWKEVKHAFMNWRLVKPQCFPHKLSKWRYPEYRYNIKNISICCSIACHNELDSYNAHKDKEIIDFINS